jgi:hypothetical protein
MSEKRMTVLVDFDGVLHSYVSGWKGATTIPDPPVEGAIEWLCDLLQPGAGNCDVVILSTRARHWWGRMAIRAWLKKHAGMLYYDTPASYGLERIKVTATKVPGVVLIDDRCIQFRGTFPGYDEVRAFRPWVKP